MPQNLISTDDQKFNEFCANPRELGVQHLHDQKSDCASGFHDISNNAFKCGACGAQLCEICQSDQHSTGEGHNLNNPMYWGV